MARSVLDSTFHGNRVRNMDVQWKVLMAVVIVEAS